MKLFADYHNADIEGRVRLNTNGFFHDIENYNLELTPGLEVLLSDGELEISGVVEYSELEKIWVARINWDELQEKN